MNPSIGISKIIIAIFIAVQSDFSVAQQNEKIEIMLVGFAHLNQMKNGTEAVSMFNSKKQKKLKKITSKIAEFEADSIMIELMPEEQHWTDSLYKLYQNDQIYQT